MKHLKYLMLFERFSDFYSKYETVVIALFNEDNKLLVLKRGSTAPWMPDRWNITGGQIGDQGEETPQSAAMREVKEETGLVPTNVTYWGKVDTSGNKEACGVIHYYTGKVTGKPTDSDNENSDYEYIDKSMLDSLNFVPFLTDFKGCDLSQAKFKSFLYDVWS